MTHGMDEFFCHFGVEQSLFGTEIDKVLFFWPNLSLIFVEALSCQFLKMKHVVTLHILFSSSHVMFSLHDNMKHDPISNFALLYSLALFSLFARAHGSERKKMVWRKTF